MVTYGKVRQKLEFPTKKNAQLLQNFLHWVNVLNNTFSFCMKQSSDSLFIKFSSGLHYTKGTQSFVIGCTQPRSGK